MSGLILTGERTVPGLAQENYWFRRHEVAYEWLIDRYDLTGRVVVDAGSGEGYGAAMMRRAGAAHVIALEMDVPAAEHSAREYPEVHTVRANLDALPLPDASVDVVVTMQVIEHLWDLPGFLRHCHRVLRPGGLLVAATPNRLTFSPGLGRGEKPTNPFHVEEFDADQIRDMLLAAELRCVDVFGVEHGPALPADIVAQQIEAVTTDHWPDDLQRRVAAVRTADFLVAPAHAGSQDLVGIAVR